jgi:hypothetical protein
MQTLRFVALLMLILLLTIGCGGGPTPTAEPTAEAGFVSPLPTPGEEQSMPASSPVVVAVPAPSSEDVGVVTGFLLADDPPQPLEWALLYLGEVIEGDGGVPVMAALDKQTAPHAQPDSTGRFAFADVPPGHYALIVDLITSSVVLRQPTDGSEMLIEAVGGETTDLGELWYSDLPSTP